MSDHQSGQFRRHSTDPLEGHFYNTLGHHLKLQGDAETGVKLINLGTELGYENRWIDEDMNGDDSEAGKGGKKPKDPNDPKGGE